MFKLSRCCNHASPKSLSLLSNGFVDKDVQYAGDHCPLPIDVLFIFFTLFARNTLWIGK